MTTLIPRTLPDALAALADDPSLTVVAGGTDLMVDLNYGRRRPTRVLSLRRLAELRGWRVEGGGRDGDSEGGEVVLGAATTYTDLLDPALARRVPALAAAARTVGSPQIRNTGTVGGNLGTASPAGDTLPVLFALDAQVEVASAAGERRVPVADFVTGPKRTALEPGELVTAVRLPVAAGPQEFLKVGVRNAMVIAVASCALVVDLAHRTIGCALGAVGPVPVRDSGVEMWVATRVDWDGRRLSHQSVVEGFGRRMAAVSRPIDDHRSPAGYRRHAVEVLARRALDRCRFRLDASRDNTAAESVSTRAWSDRS